MLQPDELSCAFSASDAAFFFAPSISFFEALATGLPIYVPRSIATIHLEGNGPVRLYGDKDSVSPMSGYLIRPLAKVDFERIFSEVGSTYYDRVNFSSVFTLRNVGARLVHQYEQILLRSQKG